MVKNPLANGDKEAVAVLMIDTLTDMNSPGYWARAAESLRERVGARTFQEKLAAISEPEAQ